MNVRVQSANKTASLSPSSAGRIFTTLCLQYPNTLSRKVNLVTSFSLWTSLHILEISFSKSSTCQGVLALEMICQTSEI
jgi:hypothetical protein